MPSYEGDIKEILDDLISKCPKWIIKKSVEELQNLLTDEAIETTKMFHSRDPKTWWAIYHHGWGTGMRNYLRDKVCLDDQLPSGNWDDYYIQLIEMTCGIREMRLGEDTDHKNP
jgi:hypothetical protein